MRNQLLYVEDDDRLASMVVDYLGTHGVVVTHVRDLAAAQAYLAHTRNLSGRESGAEVDLILLDLMLPDGNGLDWCRTLRSQAATATIPLVILTAKGDAMDRIVGLEIGADDYVAKPFEPRELLARIKAVLRRAGAPGGLSASSGDLLRFGCLEIDVAAREVRLDGQQRVLTSYQFDLLHAMAQRPGRVLTREQLMDWVKGEPLEAFDRSIDVHIGRIRAALEDDPKQPKRIITVRGAGYVFAKASQAQGE
jgi:DNA-binding response OmpR family regulator